MDSMDDAQWLQSNLVYRTVVPLLMKKEQAKQEAEARQAEHDRLFAEGQEAIKTLNSIIEYLEQLVEKQ